MTWVPKEHKHTRLRLSVEEGLYKLFIQHYPYVNISHLLELTMKYLLEEKGVYYELWEEYLLKNKADELMYKLQDFLKSKKLVQKYKAELIKEGVEKLKEKKYHGARLDFYKKMHDIKIKFEGD